MPWKLVADPNGYIFTWLIAYSGLLGPIGGILIADYFVCRRGQLDVAALYRPDGEYRFTGGFSVVALLALVIGAAPTLPGFLVQVKLLDAATAGPFLTGLYSYAWFVGFALAFAAYLAGRFVTGWIEVQKTCSPPAA
jgi:NCS1 family nucleobase:cation symporter-1